MLSVQEIRVVFYGRGVGTYPPSWLRRVCYALIEASPRQTKEDRPTSEKSVLLWTVNGFVCISLR